MIVGNVVDRFHPFSTIKQVGWHHCIIKSSAVLCILMVAAYSWFQDRGNHHKWEINASTDMTLLYIEVVVSTLWRNNMSY